MGLISWIILGGLAGWIASIFAGANRRMGFFANIAVGMIGSVVGGMVMNFLGGRGVTGFNIYSLFVAVLGAFITIVIGRAIFR